MPSKKKPALKELSHRSVKTRESGVVKGGGVRLQNHNQSLR